jgi:hypothetical protein
MNEKLTSTTIKTLRFERSVKRTVTPDSKKSKAEPMNNKSFIHNAIDLDFTKKELTKQRRSSWRRQKNIQNLTLPLVKYSSQPYYSQTVGTKKTPSLDGVTLCNGAGNEIRTRDLLDGNQTL